MNGLLQRINVLYDRKAYIKRLMASPVKYELSPGICNFGATCFHNSVAQLFYRIEELTQFITNDVIYDQYKKDSYIRHFIELLRLMKARGDDKINRVISDQQELVIKSICPMIRGYTAKSMADSSELLFQIFDRLLINCELSSGNLIEQELKIQVDEICAIEEKDTYKSPVVIKKFPDDDPRNFFLSTVQTFLCPLNIDLPINKVYSAPSPGEQEQFDSELASKYIQTGKIDIRKMIQECNVYDVLRSIVVPVVSVNITDANKDALLSSIIDVNETIDVIYRKSDTITPKLGYSSHRTYVTKTNIIPNKYLIIHLNIFNQNYKVDPPIVEKILHTVKLTDYDNILRVIHYDNYIKKEKKYELVGIIVHTGKKIDSGHYYAYILHNDVWYEYNDSIRTKMADVESNIQNIIKDTPYILLYRDASHRMLYKTHDIDKIPNDLSNYLESI